MPPDVSPADAGAALRGRVHDLEGEVARLTLRVKDLQQQLWGRKAERGLGATADGAAALSLFAAADATLPMTLPETMPAGSTAPSARRAAGPARPGPKPLDPALARERIVLPDPPEADRRCPLTGAPLVPGFAERLEVLARWAPAYFVKRYERTVWVSPAKSAPQATAWPADVLPRARMHVSVVAHLAAAHYCEHLPFYRIEQQLARTGVTLARSTQVALMTRLDALVAPLVAHLKTAVLASGYVHLDATPVDVCDPTRPGRAREATLWAYRARSADPAVEGLVWFEYQLSKSPTHPRAVLAEYRGVLQTDGAAGLDALGAPNAVVHLGCWAHARRRFIQALRLGESRAGPYVAQLDRLFRNAVENAIRPLKLGAKNWLFVGHPDAGPRLAHLFTLVENARQAGVDVEAYLTALLTQLPDHSVRRLGEWLPRAWQRRAHAAHQAAGALGLTA